MDYFKGKIAFVTGGGSGIGRALCEELAKRECHCIIVDKNIDNAGEVEKVIVKNGGKAEAIQLDISIKNDVKKSLQDIFNRHGRLDIIFSNAGITAIGEAHRIPIEYWERIIHVNLLGTVYCTTEAYAIMIEQGFGQIVNMSSLAGLIGYPTNAPYSITKAGIITLSTCLRVEGEKKGVKVNVICPGYINSEMYNTTPVFDVDKEKLWKKTPFKMISALKASKIILAGVEKNKTFIIFPFYSKLLWWAYRINPHIVAPLGKKIIHDFQALCD
jgi:NAD(P)-dependent dehydrogenase (short-subunit alcohol dehydrogenase family)